MRSHFADGTQRRVRDGADKSVADEGTERASTRQCRTRSQEQTCTYGTRNLAW